MTAGLTRRAYRCPIETWYIFEEEQPLSSASGAACPSCGRLAERYFGTLRGEDMPAINLGWRGTHGYASVEDARIAQYQFEHL